MCNFALAFVHKRQHRKMQSGWAGAHIQKRRLSTLCSLTARSLANSDLLSKTRQRVDVRMVCLYAPSMFGSSTWKATIYITAWALRVARQTIGAMRDALSSETSNRYSTRAFFVQNRNQKQPRLVGDAAST